MSHLSAHRLGGVVPMASGAAVAALRARAAAFEGGVLDSPGRMTLTLWGAELRLEPGRDALRLDLHAPEARLIGMMRDLASEALAEAGLAVAWDRVDMGALAPGLALMQVASVRQISPGFLRVRLTGPEATRFGHGGLHVRVLLPPSGRVPAWPRVAASGRTVWPDGADALHRPVYTIAAQDGDMLDIDIFRHAGSPTCDWALSALPGTQVGIMGPGGGWCPQAPALGLFGDQTALPAIRRMLTLVPAGHPVRAHVMVQIADLGPLAQDPRVVRCDDLLAALTGATLPPNGHVWFAGHADHARAARRYLLAQGLGKRDFTAAAYWD